jgi:hypothetical protein
MRTGARAGNNAMIVAAPRTMATEPTANQQSAPSILKPTPTTTKVANPAASAKKTVVPSAPVAEPVRTLGGSRFDATTNQDARKNRALMQAPALSGKVGGVAVTTSATVGALDKKETGNEGDGSLRIMRSDTSSGRRQTVFETASGVRVRLTELDPPGFESAAPAAASARALAVPQRPSIISTPAVTNESATSDLKAPIVNSITWSDPATGRSYILSGVLSTIELQALKPIVVKIGR